MASGLVFQPRADMLNIQTLLRSGFVGHSPATLEMRIPVNKLCW